MLEYSLKTYRRSKVIRLIIHQDGRIVVTAPKRVNKKEIERFIAEKESWILATRERYRLLPRKPDSNTGREYLLHKRKAKEIIAERIAYYSQLYGFTFKQISVRNQKTLWGSCTKEGNLNFNYRVALLPPPLRDYIIVHELYHLKELNHSARFWKLVERMIPDYRQRRRELRQREVLVN